MPQMAPLWWFTMFTVFLTSLIMMCMIIFYQFVLLPKMNTNKMMNHNNMNWKW